MKTSSDTEQLATVEEVKNMVRSSSGGLGGRLIGTYKFEAGNSTNPKTITLTTPADYLVVNVITGVIQEYTRWDTSNSVAHPHYACGVRGCDTKTIPVIICKGGDGYIPATMGYDSDSDGEFEYCGGAYASASISLSADGLTITNKSFNTSSTAIGTIEAYSFT